MGQERCGLFDLIEEPEFFSLPSGSDFVECGMTASLPLSADKSSASNMNTQKEGSKYCRL